MNDAAPPATAYDRWADVYDIAMPDRSGEVAFYRTFAGPACGSLLDLGCGTGTLTIPLADTLAQGGRSPRVVGLDESAAMLEIAARRGPTVQWVQGDMRSPPIAGRFDLLICGSNTFQLVPTEQDVLAALRAALALTSAKGRLVFDIYQPNPDYLNRPIADRVGQTFTHEGRTTDVIESGRYDPETRVLTSDWTFVERGGDAAAAPRNVRFYMRQYAAQDVERMLAATGWRIVERFGHYDRSAFTPASKKQLVVCAPRD